jgi:hypothetical protein
VVAEQSFGSSSSSMAISPVTPPTEDDEKTLQIDTGSPVQMDPPVVPVLNNVSPKQESKPQVKLLIRLLCLPEKKIRPPNQTIIPNFFYQKLIFKQFQ